MTIVDTNKRLEAYGPARAVVEARAARGLGTTETADDRFVRKCAGALGLPADADFGAVLAKITSDRARLAGAWADPVLAARMRDGGLAPPPWLPATAPAVAPPPPPAAPLAWYPPPAPALQLTALERRMGAMFGLTDEEMLASKRQLREYRAALRGDAPPPVGNAVGSDGLTAVERRSAERAGLSTEEFIAARQRVRAQRALNP